MAESWKPYVEGNLLGTGKISRAAIIGLGGGIWASSSGYEVPDEEQKSIITSFLEPSSFFGSGVRVMGKKFMCLRAEDTVMYGKSTTGGIVLFKTGKAVMIAEYDSPVTPGDAAKIVEDLGAYLVDNHF